MLRNPLYSILPLVVFASPILQASGQEFRRFDDITAQGISYNIFAKEGEATVQIMVLGGVSSQGVYIIGEGIELDQLMALAGGTSFSRSSREEINVTIRLFRKESGRRVLVYEATQEEMLADPGFYPALQDEDVVIVESITRERNRFTWRDGLSILHGLITLIFLYDRITR